MLGIDHGWSDIADEPHKVDISLKYSMNLFCSTCNGLWPQYIFFQHSSFVSNCEACELYISSLFLYTSTTRDGCICLYIDIFTYFLSVYVSHWYWVKWYHMQDEVPSPMGRNFIDMDQKSFFAVHILLYPPKTFFQHHEFCKNCKPYDIYISLSLLYTFSCIDTYMCLHFDIFRYLLSGNVWNRSCVKWYDIDVMEWISPEWTFILPFDFSLFFLI